MKKSKGFTVLELLVVIAIIMIITGIVLTSMSSSKAKSIRAATISTLSGVVSELNNCAYDSGYVSTGTAGSQPSATGTPTTGVAICVSGTSPYGALSGHNAKWPALPTGAAYLPVSNGGALTSPPTLIFSASTTSTNVTCTLSTGVCS